MAKYSDIEIPSGGSSDFMTLAEGDNKIRIVSEPEVRWTFWDNATKRSIPASGPDEELDGKKPGMKTLYYVIDRADGAIKLLEVGVTIFRQIKEFAMDEEYGFESYPPYDFTIKRVGTGKETRYTVVPAKNDTELTADELAKLGECRPLPEVIAALNKSKDE